MPSCSPLTAEVSVRDVYTENGRRAENRKGTACHTPPESSIGPPGSSPLGVTVLRIGQYIHNGRLPGRQGRRDGPTNVAGAFRPGTKAIKGLSDFAEVLRAEG